MDNALITQIAGGIVALLGAGGLYKQALKRAMTMEAQLRAEMKLANKSCEERSERMEDDLRKLRDETINANTRALDRFLDRYGSGHHPTVNREHG